MNRVLVWISVGFLLMLVLACGGGSSSSSKSATPTPGKPNIINDEVTVGKTVWKVTNVKAVRSIKGDYGTADASAVFLLVDASITNNGTQAETLFSPKMNNGAGQEYEVSTDFKVNMALGEFSCAAERINPGMVKWCRFVYDIPEPKPDDETIYRLEVRDLGLFGDTTEIWLATKK